MRVVAVSQRAVVEPVHRERRDCLDQAWTNFLLACELCPLPVPNNEAAARALCREAPIEGVVLTGGNDLVDYGGDAPERDAAEIALLEFAERNDVPVIGVCRGMQMIQHRHGVALTRVEGHVAPRQRIRIDGRDAEVNSYHRFGTFETRAPLEPWALAEDGAVEAVRDERGKWVGIMWHPERMVAFRADDIALFRRVLGAR
jgi:N5-(cytidine 5'-diphosphoramidyl)-L-glutamine hydrolase